MYTGKKKEDQIILEINNLINEYLALKDAAAREIRFDLVREIDFMSNPEKNLDLSKERYVTRREFEDLLSANKIPEGKYFICKDTGIFWLCERKDKNSLIFKSREAGIGEINSFLMFNHQYGIDDSMVKIPVARAFQIDLEKFILIKKV